ncbi:hypothetical protein EV1_019883 [Malus domestica]
MANIRSDQEFLPYAHEAITRGYSEQTVLKEGMFEDLSLANKQLRLVLIFLMVCFGERWSGSCSISSKSWLMSARGPSWFLTMYSCAPMGNEKGNSYWEKELPSNFDRSGTEKFIRANAPGPMPAAATQLSNDSNNPRMFVQVESLPDNNSQVDRFYTVAVPIRDSTGDAFSTFMSSVFAVKHVML